MKQSQSKATAALPAILLRMLSAPESGWLTLDELRRVGQCSRASAYRHLSRLEAVGWPIEREHSREAFIVGAPPEQRFRIPYRLRMRDGSDSIEPLRSISPPSLPPAPAAPMPRDPPRGAQARGEGRPSLLRPAVKACAHYFPSGAPCAFCGAPNPAPPGVGDFIRTAAATLADGEPAPCST